MPGYQADVEDLCDTVGQVPYGSNATSNTTKFARPRATLHKDYRFRLRNFLQNRRMNSMTNIPEDGLVVKSSDAGGPKDGPGNSMT